MHWAIEALIAFIGGVSFSVIFNTPTRTLISCGLVGTSGYMVHSVYVRFDGDPVQATFFGAFVIAIAAHLLARSFRMPMIIFSVSGIIMLVPGSRAFNAMLNVVENDYLSALSYAGEALMISGAIAMGLVFAEVCMQLVFNILRTRKSKKQASL